MATTLDVVGDSVRSLLVDSPFFFTESVSPFDFERQPDGTVDSCFRIVDAGANRIKGGFRFTEERVDRVQVWVARKFHGEPTTARRRLTRDMHSITAAVVRYGAETSGEFTLEDEGRLHEIKADAGAAFAVLQMTLPVVYESQL